MTFDLCWCDTLIQLVVVRLDCQNTGLLALMKMTVPLFARIELICRSDMATMDASDDDHTDIDNWNHDLFYAIHFSMRLNRKQIVVLQLQPMNWTILMIVRVQNLGFLPVKPMPIFISNNFKWYLMCHDLKLRVNYIFWFVILVWLNNFLFVWMWNIQNCTKN